MEENLAHTPKRQRRMSEDTQDPIVVSSPLLTDNLAAGDDNKPPPKVQVLGSSPIASPNGNGAPAPSLRRPIKAFPSETPQAHGSFDSFRAHTQSYRYDVAAKPEPLPAPEADKLRSLMIRFPDIKSAIVHSTLVLARYDMDEAQRMLQARVRGLSNMSLGKIPTLHAPHAGPVAKSSTMRDLRTENQTIRAKYSKLVPGQASFRLSGPSYAASAAKAPPVTQYSNWKDSVKFVSMNVKPERGAKRPRERPRLRQKGSRAPRYGSDGDTDSSSDDEYSQRPSYGSAQGNNATARNSPARTDALSLRVLSYLNSCTAASLADTASCTLDQAKALLEKRPFASIEEVHEVRAPVEGSSKRRSRQAQSLGYKLAETCSDMLSGYSAVDLLIDSCEGVGSRLKRIMSQWEMNDGSRPGFSTLPPWYLKSQPRLLAEGMQLKSYQLVGVNWLRLLYEEKLSGILADEMGLGKTAQVVAFLAALLDAGHTGPHLIVVPSSTLENWIRELNKFCPSLKVEPYYGSQAERAETRYHLGEARAQFNILVTTYQLATGARDDRRFLRGLDFDCCVYDEGHYLKNSMSERYRHLMNIKANFRLLLTGTPLQNNLKELVSLLSFILPGLFERESDQLAAIFKTKKADDSSGGTADKNDGNEDDDGNDISNDDSGAATPSASTGLLSEERISRAKRMMAPFVLRRRKAQVLKDLPPKMQFVEKCTMTSTQRAIYNEILEQRRAVIRAREASSGTASTVAKEPSPGLEQHSGKQTSKESEIPDVDSGKEEEEEVGEQDGKSDSSGTAGLEEDEDSAEEKTVTRRRSGRRLAQPTMPLRSTRSSRLKTAAESKQRADATKKSTATHEESLELRKLREEREQNGLQEIEQRTNTVMQLRLAANHPMMFRRRYTDSMVAEMAARLMTLPEYASHGVDNERYIREDLSVCTDFELHRLCEQSEILRPFALSGAPWMDAGKVAALQRLLPGMISRGDRILIFSQFTMILDILQKVLNEMELAYMRMDGQTPVTQRQDMLDQFYEEHDIPIFLLSTKAGGFGINLACANTVILYDSSFNPHDDRQAEDRAHRVGQEREVSVYRLVMADSVDEYIQDLANNKLALDDSVSGGNGAAGARVQEALLGLVDRVLDSDGKPTQ